jgi:hypothetical protein
MQCASIATRYDIRSRIRTLEDSACFLVDLANGFPEHSEWLWEVVDKLVYEAAILQGHPSMNRSSVVPDST